MTYKTDGKSSSSTNSRSSSSETLESLQCKTQGPEKENYVAHDITDHTDYKRPDTNRRWLYAGAFLSIALGLYCMQKSEYEAEMAAVQERVQTKQADQLRLQQQK